MDDVGWDRGFALEQTGDDEDLLRELLTVFTATVAASQREIEQALAENNWLGVAKTTHSIKGSASSLGFRPIADMANTVEELARAGGGEAEARRFLTILTALAEKLPTLA
jgi:HPt (histidine-containing phosphotransfer) domain-containing protein